MPINASDQTAASYTVQSADPGLMTITATVCGEDLQATVAWTEARRWHDNPGLWRTAAIVASAAWVVQHFRRGLGQ